MDGLPLRWAAVTPSFFLLLASCWKGEKGRPTLQQPSPLHSRRLFRDPPALGEVCISALHVKSVAVSLPFFFSPFSLLQTGSRSPRKARGRRKKPNGEETERQAPTERNVPFCDGGKGTLGVPRAPRGELKSTSDDALSCLTAPYCF